MLVPLMGAMLGFFLVLLVLGGIASLAVMIDTRNARRAPLPFAAFFAGLFAMGLFVIGGLVGENLPNSDVVGFSTLFVAPMLGLFGGAILGYRLGLLRRRRAPEDLS
jgi:hypothetical protein